MRERVETFRNVALYEPDQPVEKVRVELRGKLMSVMAQSCSERGRKAKTTHK